MLREIRKKRGLTQKELAEKVKVTQAYISMLENRKAFPSMKLLKRLARVLEVSPEEILQDFA